MEYLETCPQLTGNTFNFDFIGDTVVQWSLQIPTNTPENSKTVTGDTKNKLDFVLMSVENYGEDSLNNISNLDGFQAIKSWFSDNNTNKIFPEFGSDKIVKKVYALTDGYIEGTAETSARYQIQCRVDYIQKNTAVITKLPLFVEGD